MTDLQVEYLEVTDIAAELILTEMGIRLLVKMSDLTLDRSEEHTSELQSPA